VTTINRLLVANRGEIARRIFRTARALGVSTVAVYSDADAGLPFVSEADLAVRLVGNSPGETYLNAAALIAAARSSGADAVHPGYGFLSENAAFARACGAAGITFVGPTPEAIEAMGSKPAAKELMSSHGVPVLPGAVVGEPADVLALAAELGWPLLLKAAFGGGGRGMRALSGPDGLAAIVESTRREAEGAFGDGTLFAERLVVAPRHIEVQVLADAHGGVVHLFERECSIQRRYQKVVEECPSPAVGPELRAALGEAAVSAARAIGYRGAGTVEFVVDEGGGFFFLEVNTRLQVEHPVTEAVTGLDLVALQLLVAEGGALPPEVLGAEIRGHAIEARLYAEDVGAGFLPAAGTLSRFEIDPGDGLRVDAGVVSGSTVSPYYDAMLAKVIAWAPTRPEAARRLASALERARLHGVTTNRDLLVGVLRHPEFLSGRTDTAFFERNDPVSLSEPSDGLAPARERVAAHCVAAALAGQAVRRATPAVQPRVPSGWRNVRDLPQRARFRHQGEELTVFYEIGGDRAVGATLAWVSKGTGEWSSQPGAGDTVVGVSAATAEHVDLVVAGRTLRVYVHADGETTYLDSPLGHSAVVEVPRFALPGGLMAEGSLLSPMPGSVTRVLVAVGDVVSKGHAVLILEAMKMEHPVRSPGEGTVHEIFVAAGDQVGAGAVLAVIGPPVERAPSAQLPLDPT
jgi:acetyl/propionyl-CoA carboxylase alpha subunit